MNHILLIKYSVILTGKHPVSALTELCNKRRWGPPEFLLVHESGPDHKKNFIFKVRFGDDLFGGEIKVENIKNYNFLQRAYNIIDGKYELFSVCLTLAHKILRSIENA